MLVHLLLELSNPALYYLIRKIHQMLTVVPEIGPTESLDEYVSVLLNRSHVLYRNLVSLEKFTNKVETYIDMLASGGAQRILDQSRSTIGEGGDVTNLSPFWEETERK